MLPIGASSLALDLRPYYPWGEGGEDTFPQGRTAKLKEQSEARRKSRPSRPKRLPRKTFLVTSSLFHEVETSRFISVRCQITLSPRRLAACIHSFASASAVQRDAAYFSKREKITKVIFSGLPKVGGLSGVRLFCDASAAGLTALRADGLRKGYPLRPPGKARGSGRGRARARSIAS